MNQSKIQGLNQNMFQLFQTHTDNKELTIMMELKKKLISLKRLKHFFHSYKTLWVKTIQDQIKLSINWSV